MLKDQHADFPSAGTVFNPKDWNSFYPSFVTTARSSKPRGPIRACPPTPPSGHKAGAPADALYAAEDAAEILSARSRFAALSIESKRTSAASSIASTEEVRAKAGAAARPHRPSRRYSFSGSRRASPTTVGAVGSPMLDPQKDLDGPLAILGAGAGAALAEELPGFVSLPRADIPRSAVRVAVIGGGIAGCVAALRLADAGMRVTLCEKNLTLLDESSNATPTRLGVGPHYIYDLESAKCNLEAVIQTLRYLKERFGDSFQVKNDSGLYTVVKYFLVHGSPISAEEMTSNLAALRDHYQQLVDDDPKNKVLGTPDAFYQSVHEEGVVPCKAQVQINGETLLDLPRLRKRLMAELNAHPNIAIRTGAKVSRVSQTERGFEVELKHGARDSYDEVVLAAWFRNDQLLKDSGCKVDGKTATRFKVMAKFRVPPELREVLEGQSWVACYGPYASLTVRKDPEHTGELVAFITYEPITNLMDKQHQAADVVSGKVDPNKLWDSLRSLSHEEAKRKAREILQGAVTYFPSLWPWLRDSVFGSSYLGLAVGAVRTDNRVDLKPADSAGHRAAFRRVNKGVSESKFIRPPAEGRFPGSSPTMIVDEARKIPMAVGNAQVVCGLINRRQAFMMALCQSITEYGITQLDMVNYLARVLMKVAMAAADTGTKVWDAEAARELVHSSTGHQVLTACLARQGLLAELKRRVPYANEAPAAAGAGAAEEGRNPLTARLKEALGPGFKLAVSGSGSPTSSGRSPSFSSSS